MKKTNANNTTSKGGNLTNRSYKENSTIMACCKLKKKM